MENFTPIQSLIGGLLLGLGSIGLMLFNGKIAGISGIFSGVITQPKQLLAPHVLWRVFFLLGLIIGPFLAMNFGFSFPELPDYHWAWLIGAGLLVGIGTQLGSGCTSGHGICGMGRLSRRSLVATCTFMFSAIITVLLISAVLGQ